MVLSVWNIRGPMSIEPDLEADYGGTDKYFTLKIHHGGFITKYPGRKYIEGRVAYVDFVDIDLFSVHELNDMIREIGYDDDVKLYSHYRIPDLDLDFGLRALGNDQDVLTLSRFVPKHRVINVYVEHGVTRVSTYFMSPTKVVIEQVDVEERNSNIKATGKRKLFDESPPKKKVPVAECSTQGFQPNVSGNVPNPAQAIVPVQVNVDDFYVPVQQEGYIDDAFNLNDIIDGEELDNFEVFSATRYEHGVDEAYSMDEDDSEEEDCEQGSGDENEDSDFVVDPDALNTDWDVDMREFHTHVDEVEWFGQAPRTTAECRPGDDDLGVINNEEFENAGLEEDERKRMLKNLKKKVPCSSGVVHVEPFFVGQAFSTKKDVQAHIKLHSIHSRKALYMAKNDKLRVRVKCHGRVGDSGDTCPFAIQISRSNEEEPWLVKTINPDHICQHSRKVKACTSKFLAKTIIQQVDSNPKIPVSALHDELEMKFELTFSKMKVFRAKAIAKDQLYGDFDRQYTLLRDYALELQKSIPGTTVKIDVETEANLSSDTRRFNRVYICLGPLKQGFKAGQRELLGVDGCFVKGPYPGQILTAVGLDSNNGIYPVAYALVEVENHLSWTWFLECLGEDLDLNASCNYTFMSDRQKGLLQAMATVFPNVEHRWCLRHIHENMKLQWRGEEYRDHLWNCATSTTLSHFETAMKDFKEFSEQAHEWLSKIPPVHWAKSHFSGRAHSDCLLNNLCEVFNSKLDTGRDKPIITCLEYVRVYLMKRHCIVQKEIDKCRSLLTPTATNILDSIKKEASQLRALFSGSGKYQVGGLMSEQYVVNLQQRTCSCRYWEITGIVCKHAVCAIWEHIQNGENAQDPEQWVHPCYRLDTWKAMYLHKIDPINGQSMWPRSACPTTLIAPSHHPQVGRPKKKRKMAVGEPTSQSRKLSRRFLTVTCSKCHNKGHNSRSCKGQGGPSQTGVGGSTQRTRRGEAGGSGQSTKKGAPGGSRQASKKCPAGGSGQATKKGPAGGSTKGPKKGTVGGSSQGPKKDATGGSGQGRKKGATGGSSQGAGVGSRNNTQKAARGGSRKGARGGSRTRGKGLL